MLVDGNTECSVQYKGNTNILYDCGIVNAAGLCPRALPGTKLVKPLEFSE